MRASVAVLASKLAILGVLAAGCAPRSELAVDLLTDLSPREEFDEVRVAIDGAAPVVMGVRRDMSFSRPARVAELAGVADGSHRLRVTLTYDGVQVIEREIAVRLSGSAIVRAVITRSCRDVECPGRRDAASATSCYGGRCLDPSCALEPEGDAGLDPTCEVRQCVLDGDCPARGTCTEPTCVRGACLWLPDDTRCESYERCSPEDGRCVALPDHDAGMPPMAPTLTFGATGSTTASASWEAVPMAGAYELQVATDEAFTAPITYGDVAGVSQAVSGLAQGRRHHARVRALDRGGRPGPWSDVASAVTSVDAPGAPPLGVEIACCRATSAPYWLDPPGGVSWHYGRGYVTSHVACPAGTSPQYVISAQYTSPTTLYGPTSWGQTTEAFLVAPDAPWGVRFFAQARCAGPDAASAASAPSSACQLRTGGGC